jgi:DNA-binding NarL/FixJ family response regulator
MHAKQTVALQVHDIDQRVSVGLIVEEPSLHRRLERALEDAAVSCRGHASSAHELAAIAGELDVAVLYLAPADDDAPTLPEAVRAAREELSPTTALIAIWPDCSASDSRRALRAGVDALVGEEDLERTLGPTVDAVRSGLTCVPQPLRSHLETESLSMREKQVLGMLVMGATNAEIASKLFLAESTVKSHLSSAYAKLGVRSRKDAASMILDPVEGLGPGILTISAA